MRSCQVNLHVELFGDQVPHGFPEGRRCSFHVYADDSRSVFAAIAAAVDRFEEDYVKAGGYFGVRVDSVSTFSDDPFEQSMARRSEPGRIVDMRDSRALVEHLREERGERGKPIETVGDLVDAAAGEIAHLAERKDKGGMADGDD